MTPSLPERPTRVRHWVVVFAVALAVVTYIDRVAISRAAPSIMHDLGLDKRAMSWGWFAFACAYAVFEIPGGFLGDWMGPRRVLMRVVLWWSFFTAATGWVWNAASLVVTQGLFGAGEAGCFPNLSKSFSTWLPRKERARAQGFMWLSARWGGAFTPPLVGFVMRQVGWRRAFGLFGCLGVIWAAVFWWWYRDDPRDNPRLNAAERELVRESASRAKGHGDVPWGRLLRSRQVWLLCWQYFFLSYGWWFYITWLPTYLVEGRHMAMGSSEWLSVLPLFAGGLGNPVSAYIGSFIARRSSVTRARRIMGCTGFIGASGFLIYSTTIQDPLFAMLAMAMASFSNDLIMPGAWAAAMDIGGKYTGTVSGAMNTWGNLGGALAPLAAGYILHWSHDNWNLVLYASAAIYLLGVFCWLALDPVTPLEAQTAPAC